MNVSTILEQIDEIAGPKLQQLADKAIENIRALQEGVENYSVGQKLSNLPDVKSLPVGAIIKQKNYHYSANITINSKLSGILNSYYS